eukprot:5127000-Prymnesium_polylepis.1
MCSGGASPALLSSQVGTVECPLRPCLLASAGLVAPYASCKSGPVPGWPPVSGGLPVRLLRRVSRRSGVGGWRAARGGRHDGGGREEQRRR